MIESGGIIKSHELFCFHQLHADSQKCVVPFIDIVFLTVMGRRYPAYIHRLKRGRCLR